MRLLKILLSLILTAALLAALPASHADFGDFSGSSDYGGWSSGSDWGSGSSWGSSFDWDYAGSRGGGNSLGSLLLYIAFMILWMVIRYYIRKGATRSAAVRNARPTWGFKLRDIRECPVPLPEEKRLEDLYRRMQVAWGQGDLSPPQSDLTPDCFAQYSRQLKAKSSRGEQAHCDVHSVSVKLCGYNENDYEYMLAAEVEALITAWNTDGTGRVVSGSARSRKHMRYGWVLRKSRESSEALQYCPGCGSPVEINEGAFCPNCGARLTAAGNNWALASIQGISQKTVS